ncbi:MAG: Phosphate-starvation-inducible E [Syntrophaceae bacterium PtaB.Bin038]|nr:MAG: Phosphate-starvation-inducible E [Syntrophaceae bacterium PtaB.Bin038]
MLKHLEKLESIVIRALVVLMALVVLFASLDLAWIIAKDLSTPPYLLFDVNRLLEIFGMFLLVLIGIELLESIRMYLDHRLVHVEVVMTVAMIAIARKVIILDVKELDGLKLIGIGVIIVALAGGYVYIQRAWLLPGRQHLHSRKAPGVNPL